MFPSFAQSFNKHLLLSLRHVQESEGPQILHLWTSETLSGKPCECSSIGLTYHLISPVLKHSMSTCVASTTRLDIKRQALHRLPSSLVPSHNSKELKNPHKHTKPDIHRPTTQHLQASSSTRHQQSCKSLPSLLLSFLRALLLLPVPLGQRKRDHPVPLIAMVLRGAPTTVKMWYV